jgi:hypothetical protein
MSESPINFQDIVVEISLRLADSSPVTSLKHFTGVVLHQPDGGDEQAIGSVVLHLVDTLDPNFLLDADAESGELVQALTAVCDEKGIREDLAALPTGSVLHIASVVLEPPYRGCDLGLTVVRRVINGLRTGCSLAVLLPAPTEPRDVDEAVRQQGRQKLKRHWGRLGFIPTPANPEVYYVDLAIKQPRID